MPVPQLPTSQILLLKPLCLLNAWGLGYFHQNPSLTDIHTARKKNDLHSSNLKTVLLKFSCLRLCPHLFFFLISFSSEPLTHCHLQILPTRCLFHLYDQPLLPSVWCLAVDKQSQVHYLAEQEIRTNLGP